MTVRRVVNFSDATWRLLETLAAEERREVQTILAEAIAAKAWVREQQRLGRRILTDDGRGRDLRVADFR